MNLSPLGRDGREAPVRVLQLGIDMSKTACIQTATQCPLLSFDSLLRSTPLPSLPRCARASLEARPRSLCELRYGRKRERWDAAGRDFDGVDRSLRYDRHGEGERILLRVRRTALMLLEWWGTMLPQAMNALVEWDCGRS